MQNNHIFVKNVFDTLIYDEEKSLYRTIVIINNMKCEIIIGTHLYLRFAIKKDRYLLLYKEENYYCTFNLSELFLVYDALAKKLMPDEGAEFILLHGIESLQKILNYVSIKDKLNLILGQEQNAIMPPNCINGKVNYYIHIYIFKKKNIIIGKAYDEIYIPPDNFMNNPYCHELVYFGPFSEYGILKVFQYIIGKKKSIQKDNLYYQIKNPNKVATSIDKLLKCHNH